MKQQIPMRLTDDMLERMLADRAGAEAPSDLVAGIVDRASATTQRSESWLGALEHIRPRGGRFALAAALLALALVAAAIAMVGSDRTPDLSVAPSLTAPSQIAPVPSGTSAVRTSSPRIDASLSPDRSAPAAAPTAISADCATTPPVGDPRLTTIDLPAKAYARMAFADCSVWILNNQNGMGIHRVDVASNKVEDTILEGPIDTPVLDLGSDGDGLWAVVWTDPGQLQRIDPTSGDVTKSIPIPRAELGGAWFIDGYAWIGPIRGRFPGTTAVVDLGTGQIAATLPVVPRWMWRNAGSIWAVALTDPDDPTPNLVRIDPITFGVTIVPWSRNDIESPTMTDDRRLFVVEPGQILHVSADQNAVVDRIPLGAPDAHALLATTGSDVWAVPIETTPVTNGFGNRSREVVQINPAAGSIVQRVAISEVGVMDLRYAYGSLWILAPDKDYGRTFGTHLLRVELPAQT
jgi:hypothetical protein